MLLSPYYSETRRLLGNDYPYWTEADDSHKIGEIIGELYRLWLENNNQIILNRFDIEHYLGKDYLKEKLDEILR